MEGGGGGRALITKLSHERGSSKVKLTSCRCAALLLCGSSSGGCVRLETLSGHRCNAADRLMRQVPSGAANKRSCD